jgi:predicted AAA+ superfamily ATPase
MIKRKTEAELIKWRDSPYRKPLIVRGARQVGKTTLINEFGRQFKQYVYLNLERAQDLELFGQSRDIHELWQFICMRKGVPMRVEGTLLFIDEIQNSAEAIRQLRYFYEELPQLCVIAAGSLLEALLARLKTGFPVGRVENLFLHPLGFEEYLGALKREDLLSEIQKVPVSKPAELELRSHYKSYALIGGMPEIVQRYILNPDLVLLNSLYADLLLSYYEDLDKYAPGSEVSKAMRHILNTGFAEAGRRIKLEGFGNSAYRSSVMKEAFLLLERAGLLKLQYPVTSAVLPLVPALRRSPRLQLLDTGLVNYKLGIQEEFFTQPDLHSVHKGLIIQHLVGQELSALRSHDRGELTFWVREKRQASAEVDFVLPYRGKLIPVEVKAGKAGTLRSLHQYMQQTGHDFAVRIYEGELRVEQVQVSGGKGYRLLNLPLSLTGRIVSYLDWLF